MNMKDLLKSNKFTYYLLTQVRKTQKFIIPNTLFNIKKFLRVNGLYKKSPYEKLKLVKNKHKGERCFIIATGPSLTTGDLEKLKNEITIGMNSLCLAFNETEWKPTYYGIQDEEVFIRIRKHIENLDLECMFISDTIPNKINNRIFNNYYLFPMDMLNHTITHNRYTTKFSDDAFAVVYNGYSITYSLIQIAVYMGFEEIYLLGTDCNYSSNKQHFKEYGLLAPASLDIGNMMISGFKVAKKYADSHNVKIYNATRGGMLEVFERVDLDDVLSSNNSSISLIKKKTV